VISYEDLINYEEGRNGIQVVRWAMERDQWKVSNTSRGAVLKVQIARWEGIKK
jgi:hypothetical protein